MHSLHRIVNLFDQPSPAHVFLAAVVVVVAAAALWLLSRLSVTVLATAVVVSEIFAGEWNHMHLPPLDRVLVVVALGALVLRGARAVSSRRVVLQPIHFLLLGVTAYVFASAFWAGSLTGSHGFYALLDRLGLIPFVFYTIAPIVFGTKRQRNVLLVGMVAVGLYLGLTALFEGAKLHMLVFPRYITNQALGITQGRARGPFLASDALGISLLDCAAFAGVALTEWKGRWARRACYATIGLAVIGIFLTLTRSVWIGSVAAALVVMLWQPRLRKMVVPLAIGATGSIVIALHAIPGLSTKTSTRVNTVSSVWPRYNTNYAALRMVEAHPLFGIGWQEFESKSWAYLRQAGTYPLDGEGLEVHNVFLSHLAEIGVIGAVLWTLALLTGVGGAIFRRGPGELYYWKVALLAMFVCFLVVANLGPLSYPFPNLVLWLVAGIVARDRNSVERTPASLLAGSYLEDSESLADTPTLVSLSPGGS